MRVWRLVGLTSLALVVALGVLWSASTVFAPAPPVVKTAKFATTTVHKGSVSSSLNLNVSAAWSDEVIVSNQISGTVTGVSNVSKALEAGSVIYEVDLQPVVIAQGKVPSFRDLTFGDVGPDVSQLQQFLSKFDRSVTATGKFDAATLRAVGMWRKAEKVPTNRTNTSVLAGEILFVPTLPARISLDLSVIAVGKHVSGGEGSIHVLSDSPTFTIPVTPEQARGIPTGTSVAIQSPKGKYWRATVGAQIPGEDGQVELRLKSVGSGPICENGCAQISTSGASLFPGEVVVVPKTSGLVVPAAALKTKGDGKVVVTTRDGRDFVVEVVATATAEAVITGVPDGTVVRVPNT